MDPSGRLYRGESVKRVVGDSGRVYKQNECVFDHVRWQFNGELKIRRPRRQRERQKKAIDLAPLHMIPVDWADPVSEISPYLKILRRIFDVFIRKDGLARLPKSRLVGWKFCHMNTSARLPGRKSARSCGGLDSIVLHCLLYLHKHHKHRI